MHKPEGFTSEAAGRLSFFSTNPYRSSSHGCRGSACEIDSERRGSGHAEPAVNLERRETINAEERVSTDVFRRRSASFDAFDSATDMRSAGSPDKQPSPS